LESAEDEVSFRTVVRDLKSRKPVLQIVLLSSKAWYFSGTCIENQTADPDVQVELKPVAKVLFSDFSDASEAEIRCAVFFTSVIFLAFFVLFCFVLGFQVLPFLYLLVVSQNSLFVEKMLYLSLYSFFTFYFILDSWRIGQPNTMQKKCT
jgi:hypothetical protein